MSTARLPASLVGAAALKTFARHELTRSGHGWNGAWSDFMERAQALAELATAAEFSDGFMDVTVDDFAIIAGEYCQADGDTREASA